MSNVIKMMGLIIVLISMGLFSFFTDLNNYQNINYQNINYTTSRSFDVQNHKFQFNFNDFNEWLTVRNILRNLDSIASFQVSEISNEKIEGNIEFFGDVSKLRLILNENNIHVSDLGTIQIIQLKK